MRSPLSKTVIALFLCLSLVGCGKVRIDWVDGEQDVISNYESQVTKVLSDNPKEDCLYTYRLFSGLSEYIQINRESLKTSDAVEKLVQKVNRQTGWTVERDGSFITKDAELTTLFVERMSADGFRTPKELDVETTNKLVKILDETSKGAYEAYKSK